MMITAVNPIDGIIRPIRPIPVPEPVIEEFVPLPGPVDRQNDNGGIVPPWLEANKLTDDDPGWGLELWDPKNPIVPDDPDTPVIMDNGNPGLVPPWLQRAQDEYADWERATHDPYYEGGNHPFDYGVTVEELAEWYRLEQQYGHDRDPYGDAY